MTTKLNYIFTTFPFLIIKKSISVFEQLLYPLKCLKCNKYIDPAMVRPDTMETCFCDTCMKTGFYLITEPYCIKCGLQFKLGFIPGSIHSGEENHVCESCIKTPLKVNKVRAAVEYKGIIKDAIPLFKYSLKLSAAKIFEVLLFQTFLKHYNKTDIDLLIPIPLHKAKIKERGFNQAFLIIRNFVKLYQKHYGQKPLWKIDTGSLVRIKKTKPQTGFDIARRRNNLKKAFKVVNKKKIQSKNILLIDDVFTTGATCNEAALELLKNGAGRVDVLVLART